MIIAAYIPSILLMILMPVVFAAVLRRKWAAPWLLFSVGCLTFILSQAVHLPLNDWLSRVGLLPKSSVNELPLWQVALTMGLTAGLCEELARAVGYALIQKLKPGWMRFQDALMLGLGHGGFESMVIGGVMTAATLSALLPLANTNLDSLNLTPEQLAAIQVQIDSLVGNPLKAALPLLERMLAMTVHVILSVMVWKAFAGGRLRRDWYYIVLAILYHTAIDMGAVWTVQTYPGRGLLLEGLFALMILPGLVWLVWQARQHAPAKELAAEAAPAASTSAAGGTAPLNLDSSLYAELKVFWVATIKELRQIWRTKRLLVIGAVFLFFGMGSPLLAKLTPQMFTMIEGAEMFKDLIPTPTGGDAMAQYIKNLSQFGFILAVLLGMAAVVGEKERGVAPMILSKPMPRWAFIMSKFSAQSLMYLGAFILAGLGAYYYTLILFGALDFGGFALVNGLMMLWLLPFVAFGLLGSTLGNSTPSAGGIGLGLSVVLMLSGNLPKWGQLLPGGLLSWASLAGYKAAGAEASMPGLSAAGAFANGGAAAAAVVIVVLTLVLSLGVFEQQEL